MRESSVRRRTCTKCPGSRPDTATPGECSSLPANQPYFPFACSHQFFPFRFFPDTRALLGRLPRPSFPSPRAFGVPSIYQPCKTPARSESPCFFGFLACFLGLEKIQDGRDIYILWCLS